MSDDKFIPGSSLFKGSIQEASSNKVWHENFQVNEGVTECFFQREITIFEALAPRKSSTKAKQNAQKDRDELDMGLRQCCLFTWLMHDEATPRLKAHLGAKQLEQFIALWQNQCLHCHL